MHADTYTPTTSQGVDSFMPYIEFDTETETVVACMDERPPKAGCYVLNDRRYYLQIPAGIYGLFKDLAVATEVSYPGYIEENGLSIVSLAETHLPQLKEAGVKGTMHEQCAAFLLALEVASSIGTGTNDALIPTMQEFVPQSSDKQAEQVINAFGNLRKIGFFKHPSQEAPLLKARRSNGHPVVPHAHLVDADHVGSAFLANYRPDTAFDVRRAWEEGNAAFNISFGRIDELVRKVPVERPVDPAMVVLSCAARAAELRNNHLLGDDGNPLNIYVVT